MFGRSPKVNGPDDKPLLDRVEALQVAATLAEGRLDPASIQFAEAIVAKAGERLRHGTSHLLVAVLGATGSGKSSLTNAIVGTPVATSGVRRPTTSSTLACVWGGEDASALLDWLGVTNRHQIPESSGLDGLVLLDVPDHDSIEVEHRLEMEQIAEHADVLVWITDPEKYADAALHRYLRQLSHHGSSMILVLNKADQLPDSELQACRNDLARLVNDDGIEGAPVLTSSATEPGGAEELRAILLERVQSQASVMTRLEADIAAAAADLLGEFAEDQRDDRSHVPKQVSTRLSEDLSAAVGVDAIADAVGDAYRREARGKTGWPFSRWTQRLRPHPLRKLHLEPGSSGRSSRPSASAGQRTRALASIRDAADGTSTGLAPPWPQLIRSAGTPNEGVLFDRLDLAVADTVRDLRPRTPRWWNAFGIAQTALAIAALIGTIWLLALAGAAWLQLPEVPTPAVGRIPIPTGLLLGGVFLGWFLAFLAGYLARLGARRASSSVRRDVALAVQVVSSELVITPIEQELAVRTQLRTALHDAGAN